MENTVVDPRITEGQSEFIRGFFKELKESKAYEELKEQPFKDEASRSQLMNYLNMEVIEKYLRLLRAQDIGGVNTFMSNGLEWVNGMASYYENGVKDADGKELVHLYINLLALLAGAPTIFMKIGALTMYSISPQTTASWV